MLVGENGSRFFYEKPASSTNLTFFFGVETAKKTKWITTILVNVLFDNDVYDSFSNRLDELRYFALQIGNRSRFPLSHNFFLKHD